MSYEYKLGSTEMDMTLLTAQGIAANPDPSYRPFSVAVKLGDGTTQGEGFPVITWHWSVMKKGEADILYDFLNSNISAPVFVRTRLNRLATGDYTWATFSAIMHWPEGDESIQDRRILDLTIEFTNCVLVPDET